MNIETRDRLIGELMQEGNSLFASIRRNIDAALLHLNICTEYEQAKGELNDIRQGVHKMQMIADAHQYFYYPYLLP